jgi:alkylation response protein AidB-like acyl-CoA dehydrogenase
MPSALVDAVTRTVDEVIAPAAIESDRHVVPRRHLDALAASGVFGAIVDPSVTAAEMRRAQEVLAGGCLATWFVQAQHHSPLRLVHGGPAEVRDRLEPLLASGTTIAGIAFSHLRRWPDRPVTATRVTGGWRFDGTAPWYTGWGINDVAVVGGVSDRGQVVFGLVPAEPSPSLVAGAPLDPVVLGGARTVPLELRGLVIGDDGVLQTLSITEWSRDDDAKAANVSPAVFGVSEAAIDLLAASRDTAARGAAQRLRRRMHRLRDDAYHLLDEVDPFERLDERLRLRATALGLCLQAGSAAVVSGGGRSLLAAERAQLYTRWGLFLSVQAQTAALRAVQLSRVAPRG